MLGIASSPYVLVVSIVIIQNSMLSNFQDHSRKGCPPEPKLQLEYCGKYQGLLFVYQAFCLASVGISIYGSCSP